MDMFRKLLTICIAAVLFTLLSCHFGKQDKANTRISAIDTVPSYLQTDYTIIAPLNWTHENYSFPLDFAKDLPFKGYEDARFSPFWSYRTSDEFWAYFVIWWLTDMPEFNVKTLNRAIQQYYTGLARKSRSGKITPSDSVSLAKVTVTKEKTDSSDMATYNASATIYDGNVTMSRLVLNLKIHQLACEKGKATVMIFEISPQAYSDSVWKTLDKIRSNFKCTN
jgi:hypothetical protein